jgi:hypothetical protein
MGQTNINTGPGTSGDGFGAGMIIGIILLILIVLVLVFYAGPQIIFRNNVTPRSMYELFQAAAALV